VFGLLERDPDRGKPPARETIAPPGGASDLAYQHEALVAHRRYDALLDEIERLRAELAWEVSQRGL
jgi:hypothetical protein